MTAQKPFTQNHPGAHMLRKTLRARDSPKAVGSFPDDDPACWQKGYNIKPREDEYDTIFGTAEYVALSSDGKSIAVGYHTTVDDSTPFGSSTDNNGFRVFTYTFVDRTYEWIRYGDEKGEMKVAFEEHSMSDFSMAAMRMTSNLVAVPHTRLQIFAGGDNVTAHGAVNLWAFDTLFPKWNSILTLEPSLKDQDGYLFGSDVAIVESSGQVLLTRLVVGMPSFSPDLMGKVQVYELQSQGEEDIQEFVWKPFGNPIVGKEFEFGSQVKASQDGSVLAVSGTRIISDDDQDVEVFECIIRVFALSTGSNGDVTWTQLGQDLESSSDEDDGLLCTTMTLSGDGTTVFVGPRSYDPHCPMTPPDPTGHVRAWRYEKDKWVQKGSDLDTLIPLPDLSSYEFGYDISVSKDGNRVALPLRQAYIDAPVQVSIFQWDEAQNEWAVIRSPVSSRLPSFFSRTAMSDDGKTLLLGFDNLDVGGVARAHKCYYDDEESAALDEF